MHQIIARTALFVSKHGGQSEIVLRVKHGNNPAFGFLMPDDHLHAYFRFLVDNKSLISASDGKSQEDENNQNGGIVVGGALSLLGSVYGSGEDEDGANATGVGPKSEENKPVEASDALNPTISHGSGQTVLSIRVAGKDESPSKLLHSVKEKTPASKRNGLHGAVKVGKKSAGTSGHSSIVDKSQDLPMPTTTLDKTLIMEPPSDTKRVIDKIVEFIMKNGRDFETVLIEQDAKHGRFPFLLPSNKYYPYYLKILSKAKESKFSAKCEKDDSMGHGTGKKTALSKGTDAVSAGLDIPCDSERKEKFKMVIGKSKKDGQEQPSKAAQQQFAVHVDAASAAAILQAATRGIRNPNLGFLSKTTLSSSHGVSSDGRQPSQPQSSVQKPFVDPGDSVPFAKAIAETAALAAAGEADSNEVCLTREQKLKAERLKRAKMFAVMLKSGAAPLKNGTSRGLSVEPPGLIGSGAGVMGAPGIEREGSSYPPDFDMTNETEKNEGKYIDDEYGKRSKRTYRRRLEEEDGKEEEEMEEKEERHHKHSRKKHRCHHSIHSKDRHKHRRRHSSSEDCKAPHQHNQNDSCDEEDHDQSSSKHRHRKGDHFQKTSSKHCLDESSDEEVLHRRRPSKHSHNKSSNEKDRHRRKSSKHKDNDLSDEDYPHTRRTSFKRKDDKSSEEDDSCCKNSSNLKHNDSSDEDDHRRTSSKHRYENFSDEDYRERSSKYRHHESSDEDDYQRKKSSKRMPNDFYDEDNHHQIKSSMHRRKSLYDEDDHRIRSSGHRRKSLSEREAELEEGEISPKYSDHSKASVGISREASLDVSNSAQVEGAAMSQTAVVSNDLRAKVRAMLLATF